MHYRTPTKTVYTLTTNIQLDKLIFLNNLICIYKILNDKIKNNADLKINYKIHTTTKNKHKC